MFTKRLKILCASMNYHQLKDLVEPKSITCPFLSCNAKIIPYSEKIQGSVVYVDNSPEMVNVSSVSNVPYFKVGDMWDFDNIGVSKDLKDATSFHIDNRDFDIERILICSECDRGPIGFAGHFEDEDKSPNSLTFFLSCQSVLYQ